MSPPHAPMIRQREDAAKADRRPLTFGGDADVVTPAFTQQATKHDADAQRQHPMQPVPAHAVGKSA